MTISAAALEMRLTVKHLMRRHGIAPEPCIVPLTVPVAHPMTLDGLASTTDLDLDRVRQNPLVWSLFDHGSTRHAELS